MYYRIINSGKNRAKRKRHLSGIVERKIARGVIELKETKTQRLQREELHRRNHAKPRNIGLLARLGNLFKAYSAAKTKRQEADFAE